MASTLTCAAAACRTIWRYGRDIQSHVYVVLITLEGCSPQVFRRVKVRSDISLEALHEVIQKTMGWHDCHLHQFIAGKTFYSLPDPDHDDFGMETQDEQKFTLRDLAPKKGSKLKCEYDFGDSWIHLLKVEQVIVDGVGFTRPECLAGENACPPEDVGGLWGYANLQKILKHPNHEEYQGYRKWAEPRFNPYAFDLKKANAALKRIKMR